MACPSSGGLPLCAADDQRSGRERVQRHGAAREVQLVANRHDDAQRLPPQHALAQARGQRGGGTRKDGERGPVAQQPPLEVDPDPLDERNAHARMGPRQVAQDRGEERGADARRGEHRDRLGVHPAERADRGARGTDVRDDLSGVPGEDLPCRGQPGGPVGAVDQPHAQVALQGGDVRADARLGAVDRRGRSREPPAIRDREEGLQPVQLHPRILPRHAPALAPMTQPWGFRAPPLDNHATMRIPDDVFGMTRW